MANSFKANTKITRATFRIEIRKNNAEEYILYPRNIGYCLSIDETAQSKGDLYTILINRDKRGRKGSIIAVVQGTKADDIIAVLTKMPKELP